MCLVFILDFHPPLGAHCLSLAARSLSRAAILHPPRQLPLAAVLALQSLLGGKKIQNRRAKFTHTQTHVLEQNRLTDCALLLFFTLPACLLPVGIDGRPGGGTRSISTNDWHSNDPRAAHHWHYRQPAATGFTSCSRKNRVGRLCLLLILKRFSETTSSIK